MNNFSELEGELKKLRPVQPSAELISRTESALADATRHHGRLPTADEERVIHAYFDTTPAEASHG